MAGGRSGECAWRGGVVVLAHGCRVSGVGRWLGSVLAMHGEARAWPVVSKSPKKLRFPLGSPLGGAQDVATSAGMVRGRSLLSQHVMANSLRTARVPFQRESTFDQTLW